MTRLAAFIDGSPYGASVCDTAAWVAAALGAEVDLYHVIERAHPAPADMSGNIGLGARSALLAELVKHDEERARLARTRGHAILEDARARLAAAGVTGGRDALISDDLTEAATRAAQEVDLLVVGKRGEGADMAQGHLGSNLERILRAAPCPVLVAARAFTRPESLVLAYDGGPSAEKAVAHVAATAPFRDLSCQLIQAGEDTPAERASLEAALGRLKAAGVTAGAEHHEGEAEEVIRAGIERLGAGLLVMGAYGHGRIRSLLIGSTTTEMVRLCKVPVLLFR